MERTQKVAATFTHLLLASLAFSASGSVVSSVALSIVQRGTRVYDCSHSVELSI